jgi:hypothetical protein
VTEANPVRVSRRRTRWANGVGYAVAELEQALTPPPDPTAAGFFDVDNTMMQGASVYYLARGLAARFASVTIICTTTVVWFGIRLRSSKNSRTMVSLTALIFEESSKFQHPTSKKAPSHEH